MKRAALLTLVLLIAASALAQRKQLTLETIYDTPDAYCMELHVVNNKRFPLTNWTVWLYVDQASVSDTWGGNARTSSLKAAAPLGVNP